ncbi:MAG: sigma 54-interacting transcriptional regulator [Lutispora sp.]|nr:sigma 54-interacting transcriptional regulator [Lutispora sp.]MDD4833614.1 sigma 54-interacting transcriptional regulator [Lutispora sp.]
MHDTRITVENLKEVQSMLGAVFNATQDAISVVDKDGLGIMINPAYTKITGLSEKDVIGKYATVDIAEGDSVHLQVLATKSPVKGALLKVGPNRKEVLVNAAPIIVDGELIGSVGVLHDITEMNRLSEELRQAKQIIRKLEAKYTFDDIEGKDAELLNAIDKAKKAADTPATVLLIGESGTGKEIFAHAIHNSSERKYKQFVRVNCAAIPQTLLESELFGYEEGAFTGAKKGGKKGLFDEANGGTIFLDEIGEINVETQAKLLRVLQEKEIMKVGGIKPVNIDVRVIAASNIDIENAIKQGKFRKDLYYRINMFPIRIPTLKERKGDIGHLARFFLKKFNQEYGRNIEGINEDALQKLIEYKWPGNVRELENIIGRAIINMKMTEKTIQKRHLPKFDLGDERINIPSETEFSEMETMTLEQLTDRIESEYIVHVLKLCDNNKTQAAKILKISLRNLYYKLEKHGI